MPQFPSNNTWKPSWTTVVPITVAQAGTSTQTFQAPVNCRLLDGYFVNGATAAVLNDTVAVQQGATTLLSCVSPGAKAANTTVRADVNALNLLVSELSGPSLSPAGFFVAGETFTIGAISQVGGFTGGQLVLIFEQLP